MVGGNGMRDIELEMKIQKSLNEGNNVWVVGDNLYGNAWIKKVSGDVKTKSEAQAIVDAEITAAQAAHDALSAEEQARQSRPTSITLK